MANQCTHMREPDDAAPRAFTLTAIALAPESVEPPARGGATLTQVRNTLAALRRAASREESDSNELTWCLARTHVQVESDDGGVYLIGGANRDAQCFSDVHRFDLCTCATAACTV